IVVRPGLEGLAEAAEELQRESPAGVVSAVRPFDDQASEEGADGLRTIKEGGDLGGGWETAFGKVGHPGLSGRGEVAFGGAADEAADGGAGQIGEPVQEVESEA